jgi:hypothetical protein
MTAYSVFKIVVGSEKKWNIEFGRNPVYRDDLVIAGNDMNELDLAFPYHSTKAAFEAAPKDTIERPEAAMETRMIEPSETGTRWQVDLFSRRGRRCNLNSCGYAQYGRVRALKKRIE